MLGVPGCSASAARTAAGTARGPTVTCRVVHCAVVLRLLGVRVDRHGRISFYQSSWEVPEPSRRGCGVRLSADEPRASRAGRHRNSRPHSGSRRLLVVIDAFVRAFIGALTVPVSCVSCLCWMPCVTAETDETFSLGIRYAVPALIKCGRCDGGMDPLLEPLSVLSHASHASLGATLSTRRFGSDRSFPMGIAGSFASRPRPEPRSSNPIEHHI